MAEAKRAIEAKDSASAIIHLRNEIARDPKNAEARLLLGTQELATGDSEAAIVNLRRARELKVGDDKVVPVLAEAMIDSGQARLMVEQLGTVRLGAPAAVAALSTKLAIAYLTMNRPVEARRSIQDALAADASFAPALLAGARVTLTESGPAQAAAAVEKLLQQAPGMAEAWAMKGTLHEVSGQHDQALAAFNRAIELNPRELQALYASVALHMVRNDLKAARLAQARMTKAWPRNLNTLYLEARLTHLEGNYEQARTQFATLVNAVPDNVAGLLASGINEIRLGAPIQAEALLAKATSLAPTNAAARYYLAHAQLLLGRPEKATAALAPLLQAKPPPVDVLVMAAQARLLQGDSAGADALYEEAAKLAPKDAGVRTALAVAKLASGQDDAGLRELQLISEGSNETDADLKLISAYLSRGQTPQALKALERLEQKKAPDAGIADLRGQILLRQKDQAGARKAFELALQRNKGYVPALAQLAHLDAVEGKPDVAVTRLSAALAVDPNNAELMTVLAAQKIKVGGNPDEVLALLEKATKTDPLNLSAWLTLILRHFNAGNAQAALVAAQTANSRIPDNVQLMDLTGRIQMMAGDAQQANNTYVNLIRIAPRSAAGYMGHAASLTANGELDAAAKVLQRLMELEPKSINAQRMAAEIALRRARFKDALGIGRNLQRQYPGEAMGYGVEGEVHFAQGKFAEALDAFRKASEKANPGPAPKRIHESLVRAAKPAEAQAFADTWLKRNPKDVVFIGHLGDLELSAKNWDGARQRYEQVLQADPGSGGALNNIAWILLQQKDPKALGYAERALALQPNRPEFLDTLAQAHVQLKQYPKAIEALKAAINRSTNTAPLRLTLARTYIAADNRASAIIELEKVLELGKSAPKYAEARKLLAEQRNR